jgi:hypothetical protein
MFFQRVQRKRQSKGDKEREEILRRMRKESLNSSSSTSSIMRVASLEDSLHRKGLASSQNGTGGGDRRAVQFGEILMRDFERIAADNPLLVEACPSGEFRSMSDDSYI